MIGYVLVGNQGGNPTSNTTNGDIALPIVYTTFYNVIMFDPGGVNTDYGIVKGAVTSLSSFHWYAFVSTTGNETVPYGWTWITIGK